VDVAALDSTGPLAGRSFPEGFYNGLPRNSCGGNGTCRGSAEGSIPGIPAADPGIGGGRAFPDSVCGSDRAAGRRVGLPTANTPRVEHPSRGPILESVEDQKTWSSAGTGRLAVLRGTSEGAELRKRVCSARVFGQPADGRHELDFIRSSKDRRPSDWDWQGPPGDKDEARDAKVTGPAAEADLGAPPTSCGQKQRRQQRLKGQKIFKEGCAGTCGPEPRPPVCACGQRFRFRSWKLRRTPSRNSWPARPRIDGVAIRGRTVAFRSPPHRRCGLPRNARLGFHVRPETDRHWPRAPAWFRRAIAPDPSREWLGEYATASCVQLTTIARPTRRRGPGPRGFAQSARAIGHGRSRRQAHSVRRLLADGGRILHSMRVVSEITECERFVVDGSVCGASLRAEWTRALPTQGAHVAGCDGPSSRKAIASPC